VGHAIFLVFAALETTCFNEAARCGAVGPATSRQVTFQVLTLQ